MKLYSLWSLVHLRNADRDICSSASSWGGLVGDTLLTG